MIDRKPPILETPVVDTDSKTTLEDVTTSSNLAYGIAKRVPRKGTFLWRESKGSDETLPNEEVSSAAPIDVSFEPNQDWLLQMGTRQPKKDFAALMRKVGVSVPESRMSFKTAMDRVLSGEPVIVRSEHPLEYISFSGLLDSLVLKPRELTRNKFAENYGYPVDAEGLAVALRHQLDPKGHLESRNTLNFQAPRAITFPREIFDMDFSDIERVVGKDRDICRGLEHLGLDANSFSQRGQGMIETFLKVFNLHHLRVFCRVKGIPLPDFLAQLSYSYWDYVEGNNGFVIADSAVPDRYFVSEKDPNKEENRSFVVVAEGNSPVASRSKGTLSNSRWRQAVELYEKVRTSGVLNPHHCYILEYQRREWDGQILPLQVHRTRDFAPARWVAPQTLPTGPNIFPASFVRGATPPEGFEGDFHYRLPAYDQAPGPFVSTNFSSASLAATEVNARAASLGVYTFRDTPEEGLAALLSDMRSVGHFTRSAFFQPEVSTVLTCHWRSFSSPGTEPYPMKFFSDGKRGWMELKR